MSGGLNVFVNVGGKILPSLGESAAKVERRFGLMSKRIRLGVAETKAEFRALTKSLAPLGAMMAGAGLGIGFKKIIGDGGSFMHEVAAMRVAGRSMGEVAQAIKQAHKTMNDVPTSTLTDNLKILRETTGAYGDMAHAMKNLSFNQRLGYMMTNMLGLDRDEATSSLVAGIQALEIRGTAMDPGRYQREMSALFQASAFFAGKEGAFSPGELRGFSKTGNLPIKMYNERFLTRVLPSMITEVGSGDIIGTQATAFNKWLMGGIGTGNKRAAQYAKQIGLLDTSNPNNLSATGWKPGAIRGTELAQKDPLEWMETVLLPKLSKHGVDIKDTRSLTNAFSQLMTKETAKRFAIDLAMPLQRKRLHADEANIDKAMTPEAGYRFMLQNDPTAAWAKVMSKLDNLATILGEKVFTDKTIHAIDVFASGIDKLANFFDRHPTLAKGAVGAMGASAMGMGAVAFGGGRLVGMLGKSLLRAGASAIGLLAEGLGALIVPLGELLLAGLTALAPIVIEGLVAAFALLSNPVGWAIILVGAAAGLIYYFRDDLARAWPKVVAWFKGAFQAVKSFILNIDWGAVGMAIADALTFGLASKLTPGKWGSVLKGAALGFASGGVGGAVAGGGVALAGKRAAGGPVSRHGLYLVGERGPELFRAPHSGTIVPAWRTAAALSAAAAAMNPMAAAAAVPTPHVAAAPRAERAPMQVTIHVHGAHDPHAVAIEVQRQISRLSDQQDALLSD